MDCDCPEKRKAYQTPLKQTTCGLNERRCGLNTTSLVDSKNKNKSNKRETEDHEKGNQLWTFQYLQGTLAGDLELTAELQPLNACAKSLQKKHVYIYIEFHRKPAKKKRKQIIKCCTTRFFCCYLLGCCYTSKIYN